MMEKKSDYEKKRAKYLKYLRTIAPMTSHIETRQDFINRLYEEKYSVQATCTNCGHNESVAVIKGTRRPSTVHCPNCGCYTLQTSPVPVCTRWS